jgi:hypothetical protein
MQNKLKFQLDKNDLIVLFKNITYRHAVLLELSNVYFENDNITLLMIDENIKKIIARIPMKLNQNKPNLTLSLTECYCLRELITLTDLSIFSHETQYFDIIINPILEKINSI